MDKLSPEIQSHFKQNTPIPGPELVQLIETNQTGASHAILLLDVRNPDEHAGGVIPTATKLPLPELQEALSLSPDQFAHKYGCPLPSPKSSNIIMYCKAGGRAERAVDIARQLGYQSVCAYKGSWNEWSTTYSHVKPKQ